MTKSQEMIDAVIGEYMRRELKPKLDLCRLVFPEESEEVILKCVEKSASPFYFWKEAMRLRR